MSCDLCKTFPVRVVQKINDDLEEGKLSLAEIADKHIVSVPLLEDHQKFCITPVPTTGHEILIELLKEVRRVADERKGQYDSDPDTNNAAMTHYVSLIRESRELVLAMERIKPSDELAQEIIVMILGPLIRQMVSITTDEAKRLRKDLSELVPPSKYRLADQAIKSMLSRFSTRLNKEAMELSDRLRKLLSSGVKSSKRRPEVSEEQESFSSADLH